MTTTRGEAERNARKDPEIVGAFKEGIGSILRQWTALELAVYHQWGGATSKERADNLVIEILNMYLSDKVYKDDIELVLEDYLETNFSTICEDGSPGEIGELFCLMWRQCVEKDFTLVTNALAREFVRNEHEV